MSSSAPSRYGLFIVSAVVLALAAGIWSERSQRIATNNSVSKERLATQQAASLLIGAFVADNQLKYSAISHTLAVYGPDEMHTKAEMIRTPDSLSIVYLDGPKAGLHTGFHKKWFWRQRKEAPMEAYASMQIEAPLMAAQRIALMLKNYSVQHIKSDRIGGRDVEILEIRPLHRFEGEPGPGKIIGIDREKGLTLLTETYNYQWRRVMRSELSNVDFTPKIDADTFASPEAMFKAAKKNPWMAQEMGQDSAEVARKTGIEPPRPKYVPAGYKLDGVGIHRCGDNNNATIAALSRYTDGLNTLTVFAMKKMDAAAKGASPVDVCDFGSGTLTMRTTAEGHIIVVADLPSKTLNQVLNSTKMKLVP